MEKREKSFSVEIRKGASLFEVLGLAVSLAGAPLCSRNLRKDPAPLVVVFREK